MAADAPDPSPDLAQRIDAAIARIESAMEARSASATALARRHATLKARMAEAVQALDEVIAKEPAG